MGALAVAWLTDRKADAYVSKYLGGSQLEMLWKVLPSGILVSRVNGNSLRKTG